MFKTGLSNECVDSYCELHFLSYKKIPIVNCILLVVEHHFAEYANLYCINSSLFVANAYFHF